MSRLNGLIREYCPDGVECKKLGDFATISRGGNWVHCVFKPAAPL